MSSLCGFGSRRPFHSFLGAREANLTLVLRAILASRLEEIVQYAVSVSVLSYSLDIPWALLKRLLTRVLNICRRGPGCSPLRTARAINRSLGTAGRHPRSAYWITNHRTRSCQLTRAWYFHAGPLGFHGSPGLCQESYLMRRYFLDRDSARLTASFLHQYSRNLPCIDAHIDFTCRANHRIRSPCC